MLTTATTLTPSTTTVFSCRDGGRRYEAPAPLAGQRWAKGAPCQMCSSARLRFVGDRITLTRFGKTLPRVLATTIKKLGDDVDVDGMLPLLALSTRRFPDQPQEHRR